MHLRSYAAACWRFSPALRETEAAVDTSIDSDEEFESHPEKLTIAPLIGAGQGISVHGAVVCSPLIDDSRRLPL